MSSPLYLMRHSVHTISPGLYSSQDLTVSACTMKTSIDSPFAEQQTLTIQSTHNTDGVKEQVMTYGQLLEMIMYASKVIIL